MPTRNHLIDFCYDLPERRPAVTPEPTGIPSDWTSENRINVLLEQFAVQNALRACTANSHTAISAEEFLAHIADALPLKHMQRLYLGSVERGRARSLRLGFKTGTQASTEIAAPVGQVTAAILCSLARNGQDITAVEQLEDGSVLTAAIPSDARTFGGELHIEIHAAGGATRIDAAARIPGQLYDWGKSKKTLATLIADIPALTITP